MVNTFELGDRVRFKRQDINLKKSIELFQQLEEGDLGDGIFTVYDVKMSANKREEEIWGHSQKLCLKNSHGDTIGYWSGWWFEFSNS
ncbi:MAG: hypothetical protein HY507_00190 [Candidatus Zambryskibacteria bacterium]|nr:hypothetical protein [Candidatus Zambryskibacteria bacterium]